MKKILAAVLTVCVVFGAGAALAQQGKFNDERRPHMPMQQHFQRNDCSSAEHCFNGMKDMRPDRPMPPHHGFEKHGHRHGRHGMFTPDMPKEIREKAAELAKLRIDLEEALSDKPLNKAKALEVYSKMQKIRQEINLWKFEKKLERIEKFRAKQEMKHSEKPALPEPPAPPAPKPEAEN